MGLSSGITSAAQAEAWLRGLIDVERRPDWPYARMGLGPVRRLLARLDHPERAFPVLHLAGSKGKGSTALFAEAVLRAAGVRVGTYTSPHLERWHERFRIDGAPVDDAALVAAVACLRPHVEALRASTPADAPTFFDVTTAAALWLFREADVSHAVLEVGLGGRLDSTNAVDAAVCGITSIELEHTDRLGTTLAAIAGEKAGILKAPVPAVMGALPAEAAAVVEARAREVGAPLARLGREIRVRDEGRGGRFHLEDGPLSADLAIGVLGDHQVANAALAVAGVRRLPGLPPGPVLVEAARKGLAQAQLPGRVELLGESPWLVVDAAHTQASARALVRALAPLPRRRARLVLSVSGGKNLAAVLEALLPGFDEVTVTRAEPTRSLAPAEVAAAVRSVAPGVTLHAVPNPHLALRAAAEGLGEDDLLCAAGSVYLAGIARRVLRGGLLR